jgi:hypothetical protein
MHTVARARADRCRWSRMAGRAVTRALFARLNPPLRRAMSGVARQVLENARSTDYQDRSSPRRLSLPPQSLHVHPPSNRSLNGGMRN